MSNDTDKQSHDNLIGAWHIQVYFSKDHPALPVPVRGRTENATLLFMPGGVMQSAGPTTNISGGEWKQVDGRTYSIFLAEFAFEPGMPADRLARIVIHRDALIQIGKDGSELTVQNATLQIALYDPTTGAMTGQQEIPYSHDEPNPIERIRGWRLGANWQAPNSVPPQPTHGAGDERN